MLCENCGQKDATSIFLSPKSGKIQYLCGKCYRLLNNEVELESFALKEIKQVKFENKCISCGTTFAEFKSSGYFGCEKCYQAFQEYLNTNFLIQFKEQKYLGKKPNAYYIDKQIKELEQLIEICLKNGNLQKATKYGLEVKKLKEESYGKL
ncbi:MAG: hypothetical protein E7376_03760 [Clostridiales bacterium]|nr:hypothetical protein [Clostridiales bacterium]